MTTTLKTRIMKAVDAQQTNPAHWHPACNLNQKMYRVADIATLLEALAECSETLKNYCCPYCAETPMHTYDRCLGYKSCLANAKLEAVLASVEGEGK